MTSGSIIVADRDNNRIQVFTSPTIADINLIKSVNIPTPDEGQEIQYTITVLNTGPDAATGIVVDDIRDTGLSLTGTLAVPTPR